jgi:hypothetical protein
MDQQRLISVAESIYLGRVFLTMGVRISSGLATFSGWMLIAFAAILGTLLANLEAATKILSPNALSRVAGLFAFVVLLHLLQRYSAAIVASSAVAGKEIEEHPVPDGMPVDLMLDQIEKATFWPARYLVRRSNRKLRQGDFAAGGRLMLKFAQVEAWLAFAQLLTVIAATWVLASALRG